MGDLKLSTSTTGEEATDEEQRLWKKLSASYVAGHVGVAIFKPLKQHRVAGPSLGGCSCGQFLPVLHEAGQEHFPAADSRCIVCDGQAFRMAKLLLGAVQVPFRNFWILASRNSPE